jgi:UDP-N-acetylglucosamine--N-acetylmuramyl-(pentapeptide) pyrophosphoryl-undecaprenol N-acetylglucosamine transferase
MSGPVALLAAGGTGGHLFPAEALARVLAARGFTVDLATDERAEQYGATFPARTTHLIPSATFGSKNPLALAKTAFTLAHGFVQAYGDIGRVKPAVVVGFGGYPTLPPLFAAVARKVPTVIHEANGVMGRANRLLAPRVTAIAAALDAGFVRTLGARGYVVGMPLRAPVLAAARIPYAPPAPGGPLRLVVFGGSQGARVMAEIVPPAIARLAPALRARLEVVQQCRPEDHARVAEAYAKAGVMAELAPFFRDLPARMAAAHLVIARSGASSVAELGAIGRPSVLVPLPHALDQDQLANAKVLASTGAALVREEPRAGTSPQAPFTPERLAADLTDLATDPALLPAMAAAARSCGRTDAAERLADLVMEVAGYTA